MTLLFLLLVGLLAAAQDDNIHVKSFKPLPMDMTAASKDGRRIDQNGNPAALVKIVTTETGFAFDGGALGVVDSRQMIGEVWVWVPYGSRKITISHQQLGVLRDYRYPVEIEAERTYEMVLTTAKIETIIKEEVRQQYLAFQVSPPNAQLEVNDQIWELGSDGSAMKFVNFGEYTYRVQAPNYHPDAGRVVVNDPNNTQKVIVALRPNFGWIEVAGSGNLQGASVYIDNALVGRAPCKSEALKSGQHVVRIAKEMYDTYSETVTVTDNETTRLAPSLSADFAEVTLKVDADAEIWVNNEKKGIRTWTGPLGSGTYKIECKQTNHETSQTTKEITPNMAGQTITLSAPRPIYGSLNVESAPNFCQLFVDGKPIGETPKFIGEILIGQHQIRLTKEGYADHTETVTIAKGERKQVTATLSNGKEIQFTCNVPDAQLEIDGQRMSSASGTYQLTYGNHSVKATAADYQDYIYTLDVSESGSRSHGIQMKAISRAPEGALTGKFSVSASKKVYFAKGNLQYRASNNTWRFAKHQWDIIGRANKKISATYGGWIDLYCWGTGSNPTKITYVDHSSFNDWGSRMGNGWRTLTKEEWKYVFDERKTTSGIRYAKAMVNGVKGVILLPDDWSVTNYDLSETNNNSARYDSNRISASSWNNSFTPVGAVFLPAAGNRGGRTSLVDVGSKGYYWSASSDNDSGAYCVEFGGSELSLARCYYRSVGLSVRLVRSAQ